MLTKNLDRWFKSLCVTALFSVSAIVLVQTALAQNVLAQNAPQKVMNSEETISNAAMTVHSLADGSYTISSPLVAGPVVQASIAFSSGDLWIKSTSYPRHAARISAFHDILGSGHLLEVMHSGLADTPDLVDQTVLYDNSPYGTKQVILRNRTGKEVNVEAVRLVDAGGSASLQLGGPHSTERVLSDSYSEDRPSMRIFDFANAPNGVHEAVGSQLIFNRQSGVGFFLASLTSDRFLTIMHLKVTGAGNVAGLSSRSGGREESRVVSRVISYDVTSAGTTDIVKRESLTESPAQDRVQLRLPVGPGEGLSSERAMFTIGKDYLRMLRDYGSAVRTLMHPRLSSPTPIGWWSWTSYYFGINEGAALTNAQWMAAHLRQYGYEYFHIDEGYQYARGEYMTPDASQFPHGMEWFGRHIAHLGEKLGVWTAPFEVAERSWVFQNHKDWLVHNAQGKPIHLGFVNDHQEQLYAIDPTHPGAQEYLRQTYKTLAEDWGVRYIKLDFMDDSAVEGYYYQPHTTALEAQRIGIKVIRNAVGEDVLLDKDGSPMLNLVGMVDAGRISADTGHTFEASKDAATGIAARFYMNRNFFTADPDAFSVSRQLVTDETWRAQKNPLSLDEARVAIALAALAGGMFELGDDLPTLGADADRLALVTNPDLLNMIHVGFSAEPLDLMTYRPEDEMPSVFYLRQNNRQAMLAIFNWSEHPTSHSLSLAGLNLKATPPTP